MSRKSKIATIRGAGLAFPIAYLWYVFSVQRPALGRVLLLTGANGVETLQVMAR